VVVILTPFSFNLYSPFTELGGLNCLEGSYAFLHECHMAETALI
jgi:hypothetical protein